MMLMGASTTPAPQYGRVAEGKTKVQFVLPNELYGWLREQAQPPVTMTDVILAALEAARAARRSAPR